MIRKNRQLKIFITILAITFLSLIINLPSHLRPDFSLFGRQFKTSLQLKYGLDLAGGASLLFEVVVPSDVDQSHLPAALESLKGNIERRVNLFGLSEANVQTSTLGQSHRLTVELPGISDYQSAIALIGQTAQLKFMGEGEPLPPEATQSATFADVFSEHTGLDGSHLTRSSVQISPQTAKPEVALEFNAEGTKLFAAATEKFLNKRIAIFLDDYPITFPVVQTVIPDGQAVISGDFDPKTAKALSAQLNAGALPLKIELKKQQKITATLGQDTISKGLKAGLVGLILVAFFMIGNYGKLGLIANISLIIYGLITLTLYRLIPVTLTFPGIVGFILSVGMAVDSNILVFERFKEERRAGQPTNLALEQAFGRAWDSIKDANICTIITALILFNPLNWEFLNSSGLVRGFAATLLVGISVGLFTGVFVTRNLLRVLAKKSNELTEV